MSFLSFSLCFRYISKITKIISSMFPTSSCFTVLLLSFFIFFSFYSFKHWRTINIHVNIPCKLLSPPVLVDSTRFNLHAITEVLMKPKHTHFKYWFQNIHFLYAVFPRSTIIYGFNANGTRLIGKIKLRYQIGDLRSVVTCYVIDADTSYNLLLGWPWIHRNSIVSSTLYQVMKCVDEDRKVRMFIVERHPFKEVENYFTDSLLYQDSLEADENPHLEEPDSGNEADTEPEEVECL